MTPQMKEMVGVISTVYYFDSLVSLSGHSQQNYLHDRFYTRTYSSRHIGQGLDRTPYVFVFRLNIDLQDSYQVDEYVMKIEKWKKSSRKLCQKLYHYIFANLFFEIRNTAFLKLGIQNKKLKIFSLQKLFAFLRKSDFRNSNIQISWRHDMSKHKTRYAFF